MDNSSNQRCYEASDFITVIVGNTVYTVEHVYSGDRSLQEVMYGFLEREVRNLDN